MFVLAEPFCLFSYLPCRSVLDTFIQENLINSVVNLSLEGLASHPRLVDQVGGRLEKFVSGFSAFTIAETEACC